MNITNFTMDPKNSRVVRWLQSRPATYTSAHYDGGYAHRCAVWLDTAGYLSPKQVAILEEKMGDWVEPAPDPVRIDSRVRHWVRGRKVDHVRFYVTPGHSPGADFQAEMEALYRPQGLGFVWLHDPVHKAIVEPSGFNRPHRFLCSLGSWDLPGTGIKHLPGDPKRKHADSAPLLNAVVSPDLSTDDSVFALKNVKVGRNWLVFADRRTRTEADGPLAELPEVRRGEVITSLPF